MYDEAADFAEHRTQIAAMDAALADAGVPLHWAAATVCDIGGGGGLRVGLLATRAKRAYCADILDQHARYGGEFLRLLAEKFARHGETLPLDRIELNVTDATRLLYRDEWFDFVCSVNSFEHIGDPVQALGEIARVLRPGAYAYLSFDPIWTADTGSHFAHRVPEPWAHLVLDEAQFVLRMREAGAPDAEVDEFRWAMNRHRLPLYRRLFGAQAADMGLTVLRQWSWAGLVDERSADHPNFALASRTYSREELMTRGMTVLLQKHRGHR